MFDISIRFRDIRDQSLKLSEIVPNFVCLLPYQIFGVRAPKIFVAKFLSVPRGTSRRQALRGYSH